MPDQAADAIGRVADSVERLATASAQLHTDLRYARRQQRHQRWLLYIVIVVLLLQGVAQVADYFDRKNAAKGRRDIAHLVHRIEDCTSPDGECAKRGAQGTTKAVATINQTTIAVVLCQEQGRGGTVDALNACVQEHLADPASGPAPPQG